MENPYNKLPQPLHSVELPQRTWEELDKLAILVNWLLEQQTKKEYSLITEGSTEQLTDERVVVTDGNTSTTTITLPAITRTDPQEPEDGRKVIHYRYEDRTASQSYDTYMYHKTHKSLISPIRNLSFKEEAYSKIMIYSYY